MKKLIIPCLILSLLGCAATSKSSSKEIRIDSNVIGAIVELDGIEIGRTPFIGNVKKDAKIKVKTDYSFSDIQIDKKKHEGMLFGACSLGPGSCGGGSGGGDELASSTLGMVALGAVIGTSAVVGVGELSDFSASDPLASAVFGGIALLATTLIATGDGSKSSMWEYSPSQYYVEFKQESDSDIDFINNVAVRYFTTVNHSQIAIDADNGEYASALADYMGAKKDKETAMRDIHEALEESNGDQVSFANALVERFHR